MPSNDESLPVKNLEVVLKEKFGSSLSIQNIKWKHLTDPGENFGSLILAINADVIYNKKTETLHLVTKLPPRSAYLIDLFNSPMCFKKELYFYRSIMPAFLQIQVENGIAEQDLIKLAPQFFGGRLGLNDPNTFDDQALITLENLNYSGYKMQDRLVGLDKEHMQFTVKELAKFHAIPVALKIKKPTVFKDVILPGFVHDYNETTLNCLIDMISKAQENLRNIEEAKPYMAKVDKTVSYAIDVKYKSNNNKLTGPWLSMLHNDFWVNNMMFCYDDKGHILNMKIVDFQLSAYGYCVEDLIFFLMSSAKKEIIDNNLHDLFDLYYESFVKCLKSLNVDTKEFSRESFDKIVNESAPTKLPQCIMMVQVIKATRGSAPDVQSIENKDAFLNIGKGQLYSDKLLHIVQTFDRNGWLKT